MSTTSLSVVFLSVRVACHSGLSPALFIKWRQRTRSRREIMKLSERDLSDMGLNTHGCVQRDLQAVLGSVIKNAAFGNRGEPNEFVGRPVQQNANGRSKLDLNPVEARMWPERAVAQGVADAEFDLAAVPAMLAPSA